MDQEKKLFHSLIIMWRRKKRLSILLLTFLILLAIFGLQFYLIHQQERKLNLVEKEDENDAFIQSIKVKFIEAANLKNKRKRSSSTEKCTNNKEIIEKKESNNNNEKTLLFETDQQLGIPYLLTARNPPYVANHRIVHFDLKGAPPKLAYFKKVISLAKNSGATGILIEYEDMFPYRGILSNLSAKNSYTLEEIQEILHYAQDLNLEIIPLVQTFGHIEFILKSHQFAHLREVPHSPQSLCPSRNSSLILIKELINQVLKVHKSLKFLHIGCDEVFEMGECELCRTELKETLFLKHVQNVVTIVHDYNPNIKVIIWDDMLRHIATETLKISKLGDQIEPMIWVYAEDIYRFIQPATWDKYAAVFRTAWTASAFKGAFGETLYIPNAKRHLENNLRWLEVMANQNGFFQNGFRGIVLTGWQRYDHFAVLCELLPAAVPSLILNLFATSNGYFNATHKDTFLSMLSCPNSDRRRSHHHHHPFVEFDTDPNMWEKLSRCLFPGNGFFKLMLKLHNIEAEAKSYIESNTKQKGWLTAYNIKHNYSLPLRVDELTQDLPRVYHGLINIARNAADSLAGIMDNFTISEWIEQRIYPYIVQIEEIQNNSLILKSVNNWQIRPLPILKELQRYGISIG